MEDTELDRSSFPMFEDSFHLCLFFDAGIELKG